MVDGRSMLAGNVYSVDVMLVDRHWSTELMKPDYCRDNSTNDSPPSPPYPDVWPLGMLPVYH